MIIHRTTDKYKISIGDIKVKQKIFIIQHRIHKLLFMYFANNKSLRKHTVLYP